MWNAGQECASQSTCSRGEKSTCSLMYVLYWSVIYNVIAIVIQLLSHVQLFSTPWTAAHQAPLSFTVSNSCSSSLWCHLTVSFSVAPFSSCLQSFPALGSFPMSRLFASGGQSTGASASVSMHPMDIQGWSPLGLTGLIYSVIANLKLIGILTDVFYLEVLRKLIKQVWSVVMLRSQWIF